MDANHRLQQVSLLTKSALVLSIGLFGLLVTWTNTTAYTFSGILVLSMIYLAQPEAHLAATPDNTDSLDDR